jgi:hypothetical protein
LGLLGARPRDLVTGEPLDLPGLFDSGKPVRLIVPDATPLADSFANRVVVGPSPGRSVRAALSQAAREVAASHLVDPVGQKLLAGGEFASFLRRRHGAMVSAVVSHVATMAEWGRGTAG